MNIQRNELSDKELDIVSGGSTTRVMDLLKDVSSNAATTSQKAAEKSDAYIRS